MVLPRAARSAPVVVLLGARQTAKTTLLRSLPLFAKRPYFTLDDFGENQTRHDDQDCRGQLCRRELEQAHRYLQRSVKSTPEIPEQLGFVSQLVVGRHEQARRGRASPGVVARCHHAQTLANQLGGRMTRRPGSFQGPYVLLSEANRRRLQTCHTFTIYRMGRKVLENLPALPRTRNQFLAQRLGCLGTTISARNVRNDAH